MESTEKIRTASERAAKAIALRPSLGRGTGISRARITNGLAVEITEGPWTLHADMPPGAGGEGSAPTPGVFGRAALGSCVAMGYAIDAARQGFRLDAIEVQVEADYDDGALYGVSANPPGYLEVRYTVTLQTDATEGEVARFLDGADAHSPYLDVFRRAQSVRRSVRIVPPGKKGPQDGR
jgi:uncharacterized OsmC-like protein